MGHISQRIKTEIQQAMERADRLKSHVMLKHKTKNQIIKSVLEYIDRHGPESICIDLHDGACDSCPLDMDDRDDQGRLIGHQHSCILYKLAEAARR